MKTNYDVIVVGAGPAGLACAAESAGRGLDVAVLDEQAGPGGQIYRNIKNSSVSQQAVLGNDYTHGLDLIREFDRTGAEYLPGSRVWQVTPEGDAYLSRNGSSHKLSAPNVVLCTGAMERPVPFPGWTLPGVMTCGGMSNLYKDSGLIPDEPVVIAGSGPFPLLVAEHLLSLNAPIAAIFDTSVFSHLFLAMKNGLGAAQRMDFMWKGARMLQKVYWGARKKKIPVIRNIKAIKALGKDRLEQVEGVCSDKTVSFPARTLLVSEGIIPNLSLFRQVGCSHTWDPVQRYWYPETDSYGRTHLPSIYVSGDGGFVHGAKPAEYKGRLAGLQIAGKMRRVNRIDYLEQTAFLKKGLDRELLPRPFIDALYAPGSHLFSMEDDTLVCRCEGITAGQIRELVAAGYTDHNEIKAMIRCGMGPCQGRMCGSAVSELISEGSGIDPAVIRPHRLRPPIKPVSLLELANAEMGGPDES